MKNVLKLAGVFSYLLIGNLGTAHAEYAKVTFEYIDSGHKKQVVLQGDSKTAFAPNQGAIDPVRFRVLLQNAIQYSRSNELKPLAKLDANCGQTVQVTVEIAGRSHKTHGCAENQAGKLMRLASDLVSSGN